MKQYLFYIYTDFIKVSDRVNVYQHLYYKNVYHILDIFSRKSCVHRPRIRFSCSFRECCENPQYLALCIPAALLLKHYRHNHEVLDAASIEFRRSDQL